MLYVVGILSKNIWLIIQQDVQEVTHLKYVSCVPYVGPVPVMELECTPGDLLLNSAIVANGCNQTKEGVHGFQKQTDWLCIPNE